MTAFRPSGSMYDYLEGARLWQRFFRVDFGSVPDRLGPFVDSLFSNTALPHAAGAPAYEFSRVPEGIVHVVFSVGRRWPGDAGSPGGAASLHFSGARSGVHRMPLGQETVAAQLRPGAAKALLGIPAHLLTNRMVDAREVWGGDAAAAIERMCQARSSSARLRALAQILCERLSASLDADDLFALRAADWMIHGQGAVRVSQLLEKSGYSERQTRRKFEDWLGLSPKTFARTLRLKSALRDASAQRPWSEIALGAGYYDQAHLVNEFQSLLGVTPTVFMRDRELSALRSIGIVPRLATT